MLRAAILKPLVLGIPKLAFLVGGSVPGNMDLVDKFDGLVEPPSVCDDLQLMLTVRDSAGDRG